MKNKQENKYNKYGYIFFVVGTILILANMFLSPVIALSAAIWKGILMIGTILDLIALVFFLRSYKDRTGRYY